MENFFGAVEAFYSRFILRDLLAKITPGSIVLLTMIKNFINNKTTFNNISNFSFVIGLLFITISWIIGFAIQGLGEKLKLIKYHENKEAGKLYSEFLKYGEKEQYKDVERMVVIKETCGNSYIAFTIVLLLNSCYLFINETSIFLKDIIYINSPNIILLVVIIYSLRYMHFEHVKRQNEVVKSRLQSLKKIN